MKDNINDRQRTLKLSEYLDDYQKGKLEQVEMEYRDDLDDLIGAEQILFKMSMDSPDPSVRKKLMEYTKQHSSRNRFALFDFKYMKYVAVFTFLVATGFVLHFLTSEPGFEMPSNTSEKIEFVHSLYNKKISQDEMETLVELINENHPGVKLVVLDLLTCKVEADAITNEMLENLLLAEAPTVQMASLHLVQEKSMRADLILEELLIKPDLELDVARLAREIKNQKNQL